MNRDKLSRLTGGIEEWKSDLGFNSEYRNSDGLSWYDLSMNCNDVPCKTDTAIICTSWYGHLKFLKPVLESFRKSGAFVILAYNNPFLPWDKNITDAHLRLPNVHHLLLSHAFVMKHITYDAEKRNGWFWNTRYAQTILRGFPNIKYIFATNGDCIWDKPDGLDEVKRLLRDGDLMSGQSTETCIHTAAVLYKAEAFHKIMDWGYEIMRRSTIASFSPEVLLLNAVKDLKLDYRPPPKQPIGPDGSIDVYTCYNEDSTWKELLGFRNLFAEQETRWIEGHDPLPRKYFDDYNNWMYFEGVLLDTLCKYFDTGDRRYLMMWHDRGESSWWDRIFMPLEFYSKEPILDAGS
jgi:hypothetical protein